MSEAGSWSNTPLCETDRGQNTAAVLCSGVGEGKVTSYRGIDVRLVHQLPRKPAEGPAPHRPFDKLSWWLKLDQSLYGAWDKYVGRSVR